MRQTAQLRSLLEPGDTGKAGQLKKIPPRICGAGTRGGSLNERADGAPSPNACRFESGLPHQRRNGRRSPIVKMGQDGCGATLPPESVPVKIRQIWREWHTLVRFRRPPDVPLDILLTEMKGHTSRWPGGERRSPEAVFRAAGKWDGSRVGLPRQGLADERRGKKARGRNPPVPIFDSQRGRSDRCRPRWGSAPETGHCYRKYQRGTSK